MEIEIKVCEKRSFPRHKVCILPIGKHFVLTYFTNRQEWGLENLTYPRSETAVFQ